MTFYFGNIDYLQRDHKDQGSVWDNSACIRAYVCMYASTMMINYLNSDNMKNLVYKGQGDQVLTTSLKVAEVFGKRHDSVFRSVKQMIDNSPQKCGQLFDTTTYTDSSGKENVMFVMNRKGFTMLAMGFTGKKALDFKSDFYDAFEAMEKALQEQNRPKPMSELEILVHSAQALLEQSRRIDKVEQRLDAMEQERAENGRVLLTATISAERIPAMSLRNHVRQLVNRYCSAMNVSQQDVWHSIYDKLYYNYGISIRSYNKKEKESNLSVAERNGFLDQIYVIISGMIREAGIR